MKIRRLREERGLRQVDVAGLEIGLRTYQEIEAGERDVRLLTLRRIAEQFEVDVRDLLL